MKITSTFFLLFCFLIRFHSFAQNPDAQIDQERAIAIRNYLNMEVDPFFLKQRAELEKKLSAQAKVAVESYKIDRLLYKQHFIAFRKELKLQRKQGIKTLTEAQKNTAKQLKKDRAELALKLTELVAENEELIQDALQPVTEKKEIWLTDLKAIIASFPETKRTSNGKYEKRIYAFALRQARPAKFLLLNIPAAPASAEISTNFNFYPNPTSGKANLTFHAAGTEELRLQFSDQNGTVLKTLSPLKTQSGENTIPIDITAFKPDTYFLQITSPSGVATKRIVKE